MSFELNIISVGQNKVSKFREDLNIIVENEVEDEKLRYFEIWPFMCSIKGIWYSLGVIYRDFFNAIPICDTDFDLDVDLINIPLWITDLDMKESLKPLHIKKDYMVEFKEIVETLIEHSPLKTILFQSRYQSADNEIIEGVLSAKTFWSMLEDGKVLFNVCYIIKAD